MDILRDSWTGDVDQTDTLLTSTQKYLDKLKLDLKLANDIANENSEKMQRKYVAQHNIQAKDKQFDIGDNVLILLPDKNSKLFARCHSNSTHLKK